ncbi:MAG: VOC family protein [Acidimicrobiales bacterium]
MQKIVPNIWFNGDAEVAGAVYADAFPDATTSLTASYPAEGLPEFQRAMAGAPLLITVEVAGQQISLINAGPEFRPSPALSFMVNFDPLMFDGDAGTARARLDHAWEVLEDGGVVRMELGEYPHSPRYGWVEDRFGVNWQVILTDPAGDPRPFLLPSFVFVSEGENLTHAALDFYLGVFADARRGQVLDWPDRPGSVMFSEFELEGQWFTAMDGAASDHAFDFTPGFSLLVRCGGQAEIDRLWDALSAHPEAEQCGWLKDRFGVSWQIVPQNMEELMQRPDAYPHMLGMKKLIIADF